MPADNKKAAAITVSFFIDDFLMLTVFFEARKVTVFFISKKSGIMFIPDFNQLLSGLDSLAGTVSRCSDLITIFSRLKTPNLYLL
jgi:hypothetical protein